MQVIINGKAKEIMAVKLSVLLSEMNLSEAQMVIEHNGVILSREQWPSLELQAGDRLELVRFVGGG